jgi:hypothetical protein
VVRFVNSSLPQLAECLLAYRTILAEAEAQETAAERTAIAAAVERASLPKAEREKLRGQASPPAGAPSALEDAEGAAALQRLQAFRREVARIDPPALEGGAYWGQLIESRIALGGLSED